MFIFHFNQQGFDLLSSKKKRILQHVTTAFPALCWQFGKWPTSFRYGNVSLQKDRGMKIMIFPIWCDLHPI